MNAQHNQRIRDLIDRLTLVALHSEDAERARDAKDTLCAMALIKCGEEDPNYPGNVVPFIERAVLQVSGEEGASLQ